MGAKPKEVWGTGVPSGVQGRSPGKGSGGLKNFKSSYKQILRIFGSISHIITCLCFSVLAGIVPLSLRNGGHLIPFAPLSASGGGGKLSPLPPAPPPMMTIVLRPVADSIVYNFNAALL